MIGGFSMIPYKFKNCKGWRQKSLWIIISIIELFLSKIPNWFDSIFRK